jgi:ribonuclease III
MVHDDTTLRIFASKLHPEIKDIRLLGTALTHRSYLGDDASAESNERLEFLGDSVVGIVVASHLYHSFPDRKEGELAKAKAVAVSEPVLAESALSLGIDEMILMSGGEESGGGRTRPSILSDTFEALVAVIYIDCGLEAARSFIINAIAPVLADIQIDQYIRDFKTALQELTQGSLKKAPVYTVTGEEGADHDKTFAVEVRIDDFILGQGLGKNKKQAEQAAAQAAIQKVQEMIANNGDTQTG